jgi:hypothetical protein
LSPITSAKCVKVTLAPSFIASQANALLLVLAFSIAILSSLPLVATVYLVYLLFKQDRCEPLLLESLQGEVNFVSATQYQLADGLHNIRKVVFTLLPVGLLILHKDSHRVMLWRDSLPEAKYRELVVMLKREH